MTACQVRLVRVDAEARFRRRVAVVTRISHCLALSAAASVPLLTLAVLQTSALPESSVAFAREMVAGVPEWILGPDAIGEADPYWAGLALLAGLAFMLIAGFWAARRRNRPVAAVTIVPLLALFSVSAGHTLQMAGVLGFEFSSAVSPAFLSILATGLAAVGGTLAFLWLGTLTLLLQHRPIRDGMSWFRGQHSKFWPDLMMLQPSRHFVSRYRNVATAALSIVAAILFVQWSVWLVTSASAASNQFIFQALRCEGASDESACIARASWATSMAMILLLPVYLGLALLAAGLQRLARSLSIVSLQHALTVDHRPPILFLRPFLDDKVRFATSGEALPVKLADAGKRPADLDHLLLERSRAYGPMVGLGNPDDRHPPTGIPRGYFTHESWQQNVERLASEASGIVLVLDTSPGVAWEINLTTKTAGAANTLFLLSPTGDRERRGLALQLFVDVCRAGRFSFASAEVLAQLAGTLDLIAFWVGEAALIAITSSDRSRLAYEIVIDHFLGTFVQPASLPAA